MKPRVSDQEAVMRLIYRKVRPDALKARLGLERHPDGALHGPRLLNRVKISASQSNGCATVFGFTPLRQVSSVTRIGAWTWSRSSAKV